eukprot:m.154760 g.154760  ORF g.154760 m.154760 type:complete len:179 (-) comp52898_c0_seq4:98-634(-)
MINYIMYILGGSNELCAGQMDQIHAYDTRANTWTVIPCQSPTGEFPCQRRCHTTDLRTVDGLKYIYMIGGMQSNPIPLGDIWILDMQTFTWTQVRPDTIPWPVPAAFHVSTLSKDNLLVTFGGIVAFTHQRSRDVCCMRLSVRSLKEICWDHLKTLSVARGVSLLELGVPEAIVRVMW